MIVCAITVLIYVACAFYFNDNSIKITTSKINKLDIDKNIDALRKEIGEYSDDQLKAIIISTAICSRIEITKKNNKNKFEIVDNFRFSLKNFVFSDKMGLEYVFNNNWIEHKYIKMFFYKMKLKGSNVNVNSKYFDGLSKFASLLYMEMKKVDDEIKKIVEDTKIEIVEENTKKYNIDHDGNYNGYSKNIRNMKCIDFVWGFYIPYITNRIPKKYSVLVVDSFNFNVCTCQYILYTSSYYLICFLCENRINSFDDLQCTECNNNINSKYCQGCGPDIFVLDKKNKEILIVEVGITNQDLLTIVENEKLRKYDILANELGLIYKSKTKIIPYVMTWDGVVTTYHKRYVKELGIQPSLEAYIQSVVLKKTLERITMDPINNNRGDILNPEDLTDSNTGKVKNSHIISSVPEHEAS
ncbi:hypothetical protein NAPIS_ORF00851 [Vairimorpha apis BRL 01]|uniref:Uncharacterized protein n=1 Tax=Vairimorpha apis BRL 01 TaxID=1037528 RepID=T0LB32_9MICR|nr:hypothetical protein NAPIS_ORF00851 [Vairimorpha apis BRL 01]